MPAVGDLTGDGIPEIIVAESAGPSQFNSFFVWIFSGDGSNRSNPTTINTIFKGQSFSPLIANVVQQPVMDNPELIFVSYENGTTSPVTIKMYTFGPNPGNNNTVEYYRLPLTIFNLWGGGHSIGNPYNDINAADFDQDGTPELYIGNDIYVFQNNGTELHLRIDADQLPLAAPIPNGENITTPQFPAGQHYYPIAADVLTRADCNNDPECDGLEFILGPKVYSVDITNGNLTERVSVVNSTPNLTYLDGFTGVADMDMDGDLDVVVNGGIRYPNGAGTVILPGTYIYDVKSAPANGGVGTILKTYFQTANPLLMENVPYGGKVCIGNVYRDYLNPNATTLQDFPEVIVVGRNKMSCFSINSGSGLNDDWWKQDVLDESGLTSPTVFDFNSDGIKEIVYQDESSFRVMYGDIELGGRNPFPTGVDGTRNWDQVTNANGTYLNHPIVANIDPNLDADAELITIGLPTYNPSNPIGPQWIFENF